MKRRLSIAAMAGLLVALSVATPWPASGWTPQSRVAMAEFALPVIPPDLERQVERHKRRFGEGVVAAASAALASSSDFSGLTAAALQTRIRQETDKAIRAITEHRPFSDIVYQLGVVAYWLASANSPLPATAAGEQPPYWQDYFDYLDDARQRFSVLYYGHDRQVETAADLDALLQRSLWRGKTLAPMVAEEYRRIGEIDGRALFDDKSTAFGVAALAFSHGVSDIVAVLRYIWLRAGGADTRGLPSLDRNHLILVDRGAGSDRLLDESQPP